MRSREGEIITPPPPPRPCPVCGHERTPENGHERLGPISWYCGYVPRELPPVPALPFVAPPGTRRVGPRIIRNG